MPQPLLKTKLYVPRARADAVSRPRLLDRLLNGARGAQPFTLVCGPAGSGKTTLLSQFAAQLPNAIAWLSLDEGDNDPARFWTHLVSACQTVLPDVGHEALSLLQESQAPPAETLATMLINDVAGLEVPGTSQHRLRRGHVPGTSDARDARTRLVLVLDDVHLIHEQAIHAAVAFLLEHAPRQLHLVLSTRSDPPFALARYRARNQLLEIRGRDLRFNLEEAATFLADVADLQLSAADIAALEARTEGWIAGLQLAALALQAPGPDQQRPDPAPFIRSFAGSHIYVAGYLLEEVLRRQPQATQSFLLQTSLLQRLHGDLCDAVTGGQGGRATLATLQRSNSFIIALDDEGHWFRYHHLFADLLQARLALAFTPQEIAALHTRAAHWYEEHQFTAEAIAHALAARDPQHAARLVEQVAHDTMHAGQVRTLRRWLEALPEAAFQDHPRLAIFRAWIDLMQGKGYGSQRGLQEQETMLQALPPSPENDRLRLEWLVVLSRFIAFAGNTSRAMHIAQQALAQLHQDEVALRARAYATLALANFMEGHPQASTLAYEQCMALARAAGNDSLAAHATMMRGFELSDYGRLHDAANAFQSIVALGEQSQRRTFFPAGQGYIGLAGVHLEWNDLDRAQAYLQQGVALCRQGGLPGMDTALAIEARLRQAQGDLQGALAAAQSLPQTLPGGDPALTVRAIRLHLALGDLDDAARAARPLLALLESEAAKARVPLLLAEIFKMIAARLFLARGELGRAVALVGEVQATAQPAQRNGRLVEVALLQALLLQKQAQGAVTAEARDACQRALALAAQAGYVLLFLEEGKAVIPLLQAVVARRATPDAVSNHARKLLDAFGQEAAPRSPGEAHGLVEALTPRETEVLQLIAAGDSNQAIAGKLFITVRTVKKHASNIYGKLNVSRRTEAVARARELGLLSGDS